MLLLAPLLLLTRVLHLHRLDRLAVNRLLEFIITFFSITAGMTRGTFLALIYKRFLDPYIFDIFASFTDTAATEDSAAEAKDAKEYESDDCSNFTFSFCSTESVGGAAVRALIDMDHLRGSIFVEFHCISCVGDSLIMVSIAVAIASIALIPTESTVVACGLD